jgi:Protein of unknown function (DUF3311)
VKDERRRGHRNRLLLLLLVVPLVAVLVPEIYNFNSPSIGGMPFFYWWQLLWIAGVAVCVGVVYLATKGER